MENTNTRKRIAQQDFDNIYSPEVKPAVNYLISQLNEKDFEIIGTIPNFHNSYDNGHNLKLLNEFVIKKLTNNN